MALLDSLRLTRADDAGDGSLWARYLAVERLSPCLPAALRRALARRDRRLEAVPDSKGTVQLFLVSGPARDAAGSLELDDREPLSPQASAAARDRDRRTLLRLPADTVLARRASFPIQVRDRLAQTVRYELDRLSPFTPDQILYDFRALPVSKGDTRLSIELALCRRDRVEPWLRRLKEAGASVDQVTWVGAWPRANLLPAESRPKPPNPWLDPAWLLLLVILVLAVGALATPLWQRTKTLAALDGEIAKARQQAVQVDELRQELERARAGSTAVLQEKLERPMVMDLLRELTDRIPEDTWVQSLEYQNGEVQLRGESGQATALIGLLEGAPGIGGVSFRSPVTQVARTGKERFNIGFNYKREPSAGAAVAPAPVSGHSP
jgi:general secretion pathway protein L